MGQPAFYWGTGFFAYEFKVIHLSYLHVDVPHTGHLTRVKSLHHITIIGFVKRYIS